MEPRAIVEGLCGFEGRVAGSDAERRAASWLALRVREQGREAQVETFWTRPEESFALALHALLAAAGSVLAAFVPVAGVAVVGAVLVSLLADLTGRLFLLRRLGFRRASQNVVSPTPGTGTRAESGDDASGSGHPVRLMIAAAYDAPRGGVLRRPLLARTGGRAPGPRALLALLVALALLAATARLLTDATWIGALQLVPTVALLLASAALADAALARPSPGASDASAVAVALALMAELRRSPPRRLGVELVLAGAGCGPALGMRHHVRERRRGGLRAEDVAVLHLDPCGRGAPHWWIKDGPLLPLAFHPRLRAVARRAAAQEAHLHAAPHAGHGITGAYAARSRGWPAIAVGCLDPRGLIPGRGRPGDSPDEVDPEAMQAALELCLALVDELDADLDAQAGREASAQPASTAAR